MVALLFVLFVTIASPLSAVVINIAPYKRLLLDLHNAFRRNEGASDMKYLSWNNVLATEAAGWARQCRFEHQNGGRGENLYFTTSKMADKDLVRKGMTAFYQEKFHWKFGTHCENACHYTQVIWAKTHEIGCAVERCHHLYSGEKVYNDAWYLVCFYNPQGNIIGEYPYTSGKECGRCESIEVCHESLCLDQGNNAVTSSPPFQSPVTTPRPQIPRVRRPRPKPTKEPLRCPDNDPSCPDWRVYCYSNSYVKRNCLGTCNTCPAPPPPVRHAVPPPRPPPQPQPIFQNIGSFQLPTPPPVRHVAHRPRPPLQPQPIFQNIGSFQPPPPPPVRHVAHRPRPPPQPQPTFQNSGSFKTGGQGPTNAMDLMTVLRASGLGNANQQTGFPAAGFMSMAASAGEGGLGNMLTGGNANQQTGFPAAGFPSGDLMSLAASAGEGGLGNMLTGGHANQQTGFPASGFPSGDLMSVAASAGAGGLGNILTGGGFGTGFGGGGDMAAGLGAGSLGGGMDLSALMSTMGGSGGFCMDRDKNCPSMVLLCGTTDIMENNCRRSCGAC